MPAGKIKLYVWQPEGHGPSSYFVMAASLEEAIKAVRKVAGPPSKKTAYQNGAFYDGENILPPKIYLPGEVGPYEVTVPIFDEKTQSKAVKIYEAVKKKMRLK